MSERFLKSVGSVNSVGSRTELERYLDDIRFAKETSTHRLRELSASVLVDRRMADLANAQSKLIASAPAASAASALLESTRHTTSEIKSQIDDVLLVYERCRDARSIVDQVIELRDCLQGCHMAMEVHDWERAAVLASRARAIPDDVATCEFAQKMVPNTELPDAPLVTLKAACDDLAQLFLREFKKATQARQMDQVSFYFKLFPLVGHAETGLNSYSHFIGQTVAGMARNVLQSASSKMRQNISFYSAVLTNLFENIAAMVKQHAPIVSRHYGPDAMVESVMPIVQVEVDKQAGLIIDTFWDERRMEMLVKSVRAYQYPGLANAFVSATTHSDPGVDMDESVEDLQEASARLSEIGTMLNRWKLYTSYITRGGSDDKHYQNIISAIDNGSTMNKVSSLLGPTFQTLALFVFRRSVERAVKLDELPSKQLINAHAVYSLEDPLGSSMVDDVMYVFNQVLLQSVETGHDPTISSSLLGLRRVLESDIVATLQRKLQGTSPQDSLTPRGEFGGAGAFMVYLDDLELLNQYVSEAVERSLELVAGTKNSEPKSHLEHLKSGFVGLATELLSDGVHNIANKRVIPQARQLVTTHFKAQNFTLPAAETPFQTTTNAFVPAWHQLMAPLRQILHPKIVLRILDVVARALSAALEKFVWSLQPRLTEAGALLLDKDLNLAVGTISELQYGLRRKFGKVSQLAAFLTDETADIDLLSEEEQTKAAQMQRAIRKL